MPKKRLLSILTLVAVAAAIFAPQRARAGDLKITIPKRSLSTPVQRLNREGVDELRKHRYEKAEAAFYKAYLIDPDDPFTLNNLGYISELQGKIDRAQTFYALAAKQASDAVVDRANTPRLKGKTMREAVNDLRDVPMQVNRDNINAIQLLSQGRIMEAETLLQQALALDPQNAFTVNNLGVAKEAEGDFEGALKYYTAAGKSASTEPVIVSLDREWRGKPVSEMANDNARKLRQRMQNEVSAESQAAMFSLRGVSALNRNNWHDASQDFLKAYSLDPNNAFAINNLGYLAEMDGDLETAEFFYEKARKAQDADARVGLASRRSAEGMKLFEVVDQSRQKVDTGIETRTELLRQRPGPIELKRRDNKPVVEPDPDADSVSPSPQSAPPASPPPTSQPPKP